MLELKLQAEESFVLKVVQLEELLQVRHSVFVVGNAGCGKSQVRPAHLQGHGSPPAPGQAQPPPSRWGRCCWPWPAVRTSAAPAASGQGTAARPASTRRACRAQPLELGRFGMRGWDARLRDCPGRP